MVQQRTLRRSYTALNTANRGCWTQREKVKHGSRSRKMQDHQGHQSQHQAKHFQHPFSSRKNSHSRGEDTQRRSQRDQKRWQQAMSNGQVVDNNHSQQQAFHDQKNFQQRKTGGCVKDICEKNPHQAQTALYIPQQTQDGPDVTKLIPERTTVVKPTSGIRSKMVQDWRRLDNKTRSNFEHHLDWLNKLWGEHLIQGWGTRSGRRRSTTSKASTRTQSTSRTNTAGKSRTWAYTPSV